MLFSQITKDRPLGNGHVVIAFGPGECSHSRLAHDPSVVAGGVAGDVAVMITRSSPIGFVVHPGTRGNIGYGSPFPW